MLYAHAHKNGCLILRNVRNCDKISRMRGESDQAHNMKVLLCNLGKKLGFEVDIEEGQESELGKLGIRHDVLWYAKASKWFSKLLETALLRDDLETEYRKLIEKKLGPKRHLFAAFEIEASDTTTKAMKGDISNLSKLPYGIIVVRRGKEEAKREAEIRKKKVEPIRNRFERALMEFRSLHGPNNVVVISFEDVKKLSKELG